MQGPVDVDPTEAVHDETVSSMHIMSAAPQEADELVARPPIDTSLLESLSPDRLDHIYLYRESDKDLSYRYRLTIVDRPLVSTTLLNHATAVFIIPAGREGEYMFATRTGLQSVAESAGCARLLAVALGRRYEFGSQEALQEELAYVAQVVSQQGKFLPPEHYKRYRKSDAMSVIPFMALDGVGSRNVLAEGETLLSGTYLVEQVKVDDTLVRRLYFMDNPFVIQSEVAMISDRDVDKTHLSFDYHKSMTAGLLALTARRTHGVIIGLGGGGLLNFLQATLPSTHLTVVELDASVVTVAEKYFGFVRNYQTTVRVGDGLSLIPSDEGSKINDSIVLEPSSLDFVAVDVDSKDSTVGMSCPPQAFVEVPFLTRLKSLLHPEGWLVMNVSARDPTMFELVKTNFQAVFGSIFCSDNDKEEREDVNVVLFATSANVTLAPLTDRLDSMHKALEEFVNSTEIPPSWQSTLSDLEDCVASIRMSDKMTKATNKNKKTSGGKRKKGKRK